MSGAGGLAVGVDAGGTRTRILVADGDERILGRAENGGLDWLSAPAEAERTMAAAIGQALSGAQASELDVSTACLGSAGADRASVATRAASALVGRLPGARVRVVPDAALGLASAGRSVGVAVVAGTGSIAYGRNPSGRTARAGGWGYLVGDEGSGYDIGRQAVLAALAAEDGRGEGTLLVPALVRACKIDVIGDLIEWLAAAPAPRLALASLAPTVGEIAEQGDRVALGILSRAGLELGRAASAVVRRLGMRGQGVDLVLIGSVFMLGEPLVAPLVRVVERESRVSLVWPSDEPAMGAVRLALGRAEW